MITYVDGKFVDEREAVIPVTDLAILRGYGVFDVMRAYNGRIFRAHDHAERLVQSAGMIGIPVRHSNDGLIAIAQETLARNNLKDAVVRVVLTGGDGADSITPLGNPRLLVFAAPYKPPPADDYKNGVKVITTSHKRFLPYAKTIHYIPAILAMKTAHEQGAVEAIYINGDELVSEGTRTSVFMFIKNRLITPREDVLPGITRKVVLELAERVFPIDIRDVKLDELIGADEVFITSTTREIQPVRQIDDERVLLGENTRKLMAAFKELVSRQT
ncbi:MAG: aminotransferase class IV [Chloroflexi bacterium]|nr:aminotransferase class IV [Chloroflexota bacterium]